MKKTLDMYIKKALYYSMIFREKIKNLKKVKKTLDMYSKKALYLGINNG